MQCCSMLMAVSSVAQEVTTDPLEDYCKGEPDADECRVYEA